MTLEKPLSKILLLLLVVALLSASSFRNNSEEVARRLQEAALRAQTLQKELGTERIELIEIAIATAKQHNVPPGIVLAIITKESNWNILAENKFNKNKSKDSGLMQLNSLNYKEFKKKFNNNKDFDLKDPIINIHIGVQYLESLHDMFGDWSLAIAAYNCGPTLVRAKKIPASTKRYTSKVLEKSKLLASIVIL